MQDTPSFKLDFWVYSHHQPQNILDMYMEKQVSSKMQTKTLFLPLKFPIFDSVFSSHVLTHFSKAPVEKLKVLHLTINTVTYYN